MIAAVPKKIRIYLKVRRLAEDYYEAQYREYNADGTLCGGGYEDFSKERLKSQTKYYEVRTFTGKVMHGTRNEGWRMTAISGWIRVSAKTSGLTAAKMAFKNVARVERIR